MRIDRRRKLPVTVFLKALGHSSEEILNYFYNRQTIIIAPEGLRRKLDLKLLVGTAAPADIFIEGTDEILVRKNKKITRAALKRLGDRDIAPLVMKKEELAGKVIARDIIDEATGEVVSPCNKEIALDEVDQFVEDLANRNIKSFDGSSSKRESSLPH